jgi:hypothetical protein
MPTIVFDVLEILGAFFRFLGLLVLGLGTGWLTLHGFRKEIWQLQIAVFLGFIGAAIAMATFQTAGALAGYALGAGTAILVWGIPRPKKEDDKD